MEEEDDADFTSENDLNLDVMIVIMIHRKNR